MFAPASNNDPGLLLVVVPTLTTGESRDTRHAREWPIVGMRNYLMSRERKGLTASGVVPYDTIQRITSGIHLHRTSPPLRMKQDGRTRG